LRAFLGFGKEDETMQSRTGSLWGRTALSVMSLAAILIGAASAPAMAAPEDYKGFFLALDLASTQPTGLDQQYATYVDQSGGPANGFGTRQVIENDADLSYSGSIGYAWGPLGGLAVSYWGFDNEDKVEDSVNGSLVYPTVFCMYAFNYGQSFALGSGGYPVTLTATGQVKASTIDIDYFRPMQAGEKLTITWIAGLRSATFEEDRTFDGIDSTGYYYIETKHIESDGFGVKLGATAMFGFTDHFGLQGGMAFSFLQATIDAKATRNASSFIDEVTSSDDYSRGEIRDYDLRAVWTWDKFDFWVGYGGQTWDGLVTDPLNGNCCAASADLSERDSIAFNKAHAGVAFRFGGQ
jgi:hypothetical protein